MIKGALIEEDIIILNICTPYSEATYFNKKYTIALQCTINPKLINARGIQCLSLSNRGVICITNRKLWLLDNIIHQIGLQIATEYSTQTPKTMHFTHNYHYDTHSPQMFFLKYTIPKYTKQISKITENLKLLLESYTRQNSLKPITKNL